MFKNFDIGDIIIVILIAIITTLLILGCIGINRLNTMSQPCVEKGMVYDKGICVKDASKD